jgi:hypothetical protein
MVGVSDGRGYVRQLQKQLVVAVSWLLPHLQQSFWMHGFFKVSSCFSPGTLKPRNKTRQEETNGEIWTTPATREIHRKTDNLRSAAHPEYCPSSSRAGVGAAAWRVGKHPHLQTLIMQLNSFIRATYKNYIKGGCFFHNILKSIPDTLYCTSKFLKTSKGSVKGCCYFHTG